MRVRVPRLGIDVVVVEGTSDAALRAGAGHYRKSALPEEEGNVALAGHRTTFGKPFNRMDELSPGDEILVTTPLGRYVYTVTRAPWVVTPSDLSPLHRYPQRGSYLTLMSCHPEGSATYRIVARARLTRTVDRLLAGGDVR
jgi:sortase A